MKFDDSGAVPSESRSQTPMETTLKLISGLLDDLRDAGILEYVFVSPRSASRVNAEEVEAAIQAFASNLKSTLEEKPLDKGNIQIKAASREILEKRIDAFLQRKSEERQKLTYRVQDGECSRTLPARYSKIRVEYAHNEAGPSAHGAKSIIAPEDRGIETRVSTVEKHLGLEAAHTTNLLLRMKSIEDRLLYLESVSPEYQSLK